VNGGRDGRRVLRIRNQRGLHARAAAKFVMCAEQFEAEVTVQRQDMTVSGRSIMGLMMLAAAQGSEIEVTARGPQADAVLAALAELVDGGFNETS
jgi:phosphocarrier protein